jgi:hypothetical protein
MKFSKLIDHILESRLFNYLITSSIYLNIFILCLELTSYRNDYQILIIICLILFKIEFLLKLTKLGLKYFTCFFNLVDLFNLLTHLIYLLTRHFLFDALRALQVLRVIRYSKCFRILILTFINSWQSLVAIGCLMVLFIYIFAVSACILFHDIDPQETRFKSIINSIFTLFQVLTLDDWYDIYKKNLVRQPFKNRVKLIPIFLLVYLIVQHYIMLNLFLSVLVDNFYLTMETFDKQQKENSQKKLENDRSVSSMHENQTQESNCLVDETKLLLNEPNEDFLNKNQNNSNEESIDYQHEIQAILKNLFDKDKISQNQHQLLQRHYQLLASIEYYTYKNKELFSILDNLIDLLTEMEGDTY